MCFLAAAQDDRIIHVARTHAHAAFTIRLRWHLNNELSLFVLPRLSPPVEVRLSGHVVFNANHFIQAVSSGLLGHV